MCDSLSDGRQLPLKANKAFGDREFGQPGDAVDVQFTHDPFSVGLDRAHTHTEAAGNFLVAQTFGDRNQHLPFTRADLSRMRPLARTTDIMVEGQARHILAEMSASGTNVFNGLE